jgi:hypothetical protein
VAGNDSSNCYIYSGSTWAPLGYDLDDGSSCRFNQVGDLQNTNPQLGPLADNGGPTQTMSPLIGSPAIDAGTDSGCPATDQRGVARPQGASCDIGAVEALIISGNAGVAGATLNYTGGPTTADGSGNYAILVPYGWSGTVIPSKGGYIFSPASRTYTSVSSSRTGQNYSAAIPQYLPLLMR